MYQQMMESAKALDKLHKQNEAYVNGTTSTMDGMESKVILFHFPTLNIMKNAD